MKRKRRGVLLPGVALTVLCCLGVFALFSVAGSSLERVLPQVGSRQPDPDPRGVPVPSATASAHSDRTTPSTSPSAAPGSAPSTKATRTPGGSTGATSSPTSAAPPASVAPPAPPRCAAGSRTVSAAADVYVDQNEPNKNFRAVNQLRVASRDNERNSRALVRFALPSLPAGCTLRSAVLKAASAEATGRTLTVSRATKAWSESTVTWNNAPGVTGVAASAKVVAGTMSWTVTDAVRAMASTNHGFVVRDSAENSRPNVAEAVLSGPVLVLTWS